MFCNIFPSTCVSFVYIVAQYHTPVVPPFQFLPFSPFILLFSPFLGKPVVGSLSFFLHNHQHPFSLSSMLLRNSPATTTIRNHPQTRKIQLQQPKQTNCRASTRENTPLRTNQNSRCRWQRGPASTLFRSLRSRTFPEIKPQTAFPMFYRSSRLSPLASTSDLDVQKEGAGHNKRRNIHN